MKLTIIITVYNKEHYLQRAFDALLNQQNIESDDYEILAVNDGSTDESAITLEKIARQNKKVRILTQQNLGLSMARNNGVEIANGDYIWFVDADDVISPKAVNLIINTVENRPDVIPLYAETKGRDHIRNQISPTAKTGKDILLGGKWEPCGVFYVFRKEFLCRNSLRFMPGVYHEDSEFTPRMLYVAESVKVVPVILYTVIHEPNSITQVPRAKRAFDLLIVADSLNSFVENVGEIGTDIGQVFDNIIAVIINNGFSIITRNNKKKQKEFDYVFMHKPQLIRPLLSAKGIKYAIEAVLFKLFPFHNVLIYKLMKLFV